MKMHYTDGIIWWVDNDGNFRFVGTPKVGTLTADLNSALRGSTNRPVGGPSTSGPYYCPVCNKPWNSQIGASLCCKRKKGK